MLLGQQYQKNTLTWSGAEVAHLQFFYSLKYTCQKQERFQQIQRALHLDLGKYQTPSAHDGGYISQKILTK